MGPPAGGKSTADMTTNNTTSDEIERLFAEAISAGHAAAEAQAELARHAARRREAVTQLRTAGVSYGQIADRLGVSRSGVQSILRGPHQT